MMTDCDRKTWMGLLARAPAPLLAELWAQQESPGHKVLRAPEMGSAMVQGRMGASGGAFNLGEVTVTRCSVQLDGGSIGHAYVQGRDKAKALSAALIDALMQTEAAEALQQSLLQPLQRDEQQRKSKRADKAAATKVDFFTMVRGED